MNWTDLIATYSASGNDQWSTYLGALVMLLCFGGAYWLLRKPVSRDQYNRRMLLAMLLFFGGLLGMGTAFFSYWSWQRSGEVKIYSQGIQVGQEQISYQDIKTIYFKEDRATNVFDPQGAEQYRFLVIEPKDDSRPLLIPEAYFPIGEIKNHIGEQLK